MTYKEIQKYLLGDCVVRNDEFEYKTESNGEDLFCREIGTVNWRYVFGIGAYEKEMEWELVGKKLEIHMKCSASEDIKNCCNQEKCCDECTYEDCHEGCAEWDINQNCKGCDWLIK